MSHGSHADGCPGQEVKINGDRINGLFHLYTYEWGFCWGYNPLIRSPLIHMEVEIVPIGIHGTNGRFTYQFTIKINHSCW